MQRVVPKPFCKLLMLLETRAPLGSANGFNNLQNNSCAAASCTANIRQREPVARRRRVPATLRFSVLVAQESYFCGAVHKGGSDERVPMVKGRLDSKATTATGYAWLVWEKEKPNQPRLMWVPPCRRQLERKADYRYARTSCPWSA